MELWIHLPLYLAFMAGKKVMRRMFIGQLAGMLLACGICAVAIFPATPPAAASASGAPPAKAAPALDPGEKIFEQNCARCHVPPMSFSPRVTGTIIAHMRMRARLTRKEELQLLKYLAP